jgi:hypothetical protein
MGLPSIYLPLLKNDIISNSGLFQGQINVNDQVIADYYNTPSSGIYKNNNTINCIDMLFWASNGPFASLQNCANGSGTNVLRSCALGCIQLCSQIVGSFDINKVGLVTMITTLRVKNILNSGDTTGLQNLVRISPATSGEALFGNGISISSSDVSSALRGYR